jgi:ABC-2 type transport system ATP-binding protein
MTKPDPVARVTGLTKKFGAFTAIRNVSFTIECNKICGLLGRNGAGKTTLMQLLTGQQFATSGSLEMFGASPVENTRVLQSLCFIKESQKYPDSFGPTTCSPARRGSSSTGTPTSRPASPTIFGCR